MIVNFPFLEIPKESDHLLLLRTCPPPDDTKSNQCALSSIDYRAVGC